MAGFSGQFLDTVGMEYESIALNQDQVREVLEKLRKKLGDFAGNIHLTRDASTEFTAEYVPTGGAGFFVSTHTTAMKDFLKRGGMTKTMGFELFLSPLEIPQFERLVYPMIFELQAAGDFVSSRASIHFHYGFVNHLRYLRNALKISLNLDPILYRLGGMGGTFRGYCNAAAYARPLLNSTAVRLVKNDENSESRKTKEEYVQIINPLAALEAETLTQFWASFGVNYPGGGTDKYHPSRYSGINFYAVPAHGTLEFRHCNQTQRVPLIVAVGKFLRAVTELSVVINKNDIHQFTVLNPNVEVSVDVAAELLNRLHGLFVANEVGFIPSPQEMTIIMETIEKSHFVEIPEDVVVKTHVEKQCVWEGVATLGKLKKVRNPKNSEYTDIHNINEKADVSIFS